MRYRTCTLSFLVASLAIAAPNAAQMIRADGAQPSIQQFLKIRSPQSATYLPDGSLLVRDRPEGVYQLYQVVPERKGEALSYEPGVATFTKLTEYPDGLAGFSASPDGKHVILMHAPGGNEYTALSLLELPAKPGTQPKTLLSKPRVQARVNLWLRDGSGFVYSANDDSPTDFNLYRWDLAAGKSTRILAEKGAWGAADVSADGSRLLVSRYVSASDAHVYELDVKRGKLQELTIKPADGTAACELAGYMPGERAVLMTSDLEDGKSKLFVRDLKSGKVRKPIASLDRFELDGAEVNETRQFMVAIANQSGFGVMTAYSLPDFKPIALPEMERGVVFPLRFGGVTLVWTNSSGRTASAAYATTFDPKGGAPITRQITWADDQGVDLSSFSLPELVTYKSFDGLEITALLYLPTGYVKGTPIPFVIDYHGGPEGQHRPGFYPTDQYLLSRGYGMLMPNVRGSTGFGRGFQMLDNYKQRWDSVKDGVAAAEWLVANGYATPSRIASTGGSYGGYMSVACVVEDQERVDRGERQERMFGACVDVVGVVNLKTFLEKTADYRRALREVEYGPLSDPEFLTSVSPVHKADKINVPMFIAHGFNDPRVPVEEAMQLAVALKDRGQSPRVFIAPDEGHGFQKLDNRIYYYERMAAFLDETIGRGAAPKGGVAESQ